MIYRGHAQHVQTAMVPITPAQVQEGWHEIQRQEEMQSQLLMREEKGLLSQTQPPQKQANTTRNIGNTQTTIASDISQKTRPAVAGTQKKKRGGKEIKQRSQQSTANSVPEIEQPKQPIRDQDDDEPDRL